MFRYLIHFIFTVLLSAQSVSAEVYTPAPGTPERSGILNAIRVMAGYDLGGAIVFVVSSLEVMGDHAFLMAEATRPGGQQIDLTQTPLVLRDGIPTDFIDGASVQAFLKRLDGHWYVEAYAVGATDVWWAGPPYCADYGEMLPQGAC